MTEFEHTTKVDLENGNPAFAKPVLAAAAVKLYDVIYADPAWRYDFAETDNRKIENHYPTMSVEEICSLKVPAKKNAVLFMWATAPKLREAFMVMDAWGFEYKTHAIWDKKIIGMGYWFRGQHELLMVGVKGKFSPPESSKVISSVITGKRSKHSRKPYSVRQNIKEWFPDADRLEMFARKPHDLFAEEDFAGWDLWGNQAGESVILETDSSSCS